MPLKFEELVELAVHCGGGGGVPQARALGENVIFTAPLSPNVTVPETETSPVSVPTFVVMVASKSPLESGVTELEPVKV